MNDEQKQALELRESGLSRAEIAAAMGLTERQVKTRLADARRWLESDPSAQFAAKASGANVMPHSYWVKRDGVSAYFQTPKEEGSVSLIDRVSDAFKDIPAYVPQEAEFTASDLLHVYALFDAHIGMRAYSLETMGDDYDLRHAERDIKAAITRLSEAGGGEALLVVGGDTLHHDNNDNTTFASKHPLDVDGRIFRVTKMAVDVIAWSAERLSQKHEKVTIKVHRGNHDPHAHVALAIGLHQRYRECGRIVVDMGEADWFWKQWGKCAVFTTHGDRPKSPQEFILKMADICPFYSQSPHRIAITGHVHKMQMQRIGGALWCSVDGFCPPDEYGSQFSGRRGLAKMTLDKERGLTSMSFDPIIRIDDS